MHRRRRISHLVAVAAALGFTTAAFAQEATGMQAPPADPAGLGAPPALGQADGTAIAGEGAAAVGDASLGAKARESTGALYGVAARWRYVMVPGWFLGAFTDKNVPLYTPGCFALEGFRRKVDKDDPNRSWELVVGVGYQSMSPPDGYWLGKGKNPNVDADLVQTPGLSLITMDAAFISRQYFNPYFGIHYGAGLGLAIVRGKVMRISAQYDQKTGQYYVKSRDGALICGADPKTCSQTLLTQSQGPGDMAGDPHQFEEHSVPPALPIINVLVGVDGRVPLPNNQALEFRLEGGFFDAFFVGLAMGYVM